MKKRSRLKKGLAILLSLAMVVGLVPGVGTMKVSAETVADVWNGSTASSFAGGSGTQADPYQIATGAQLAYFAKVVNATKYADNDYAKAYYKLTANIDLNNKTLGPIGKATSVYSCFNGYFDGNNKTISNYSGSYGLFYKVGGDVTIKDLTIENINISGSSYIGGLVYMVDDDMGTSAHISNCHISGTITSTYAAVGLVYRADSPLTIEDCSNSAEITGQSYSAGILGGNYTQSTFDDYFVIIRNCTNSGKIVNTSTSSGDIGAAGIAGSLKYGKTLIENCVNTGEIVAQNGGEKYAGIVSNSSSTEGNTIRNCENYGAVTCDVAKSSIYTAGICAAASYTEIYDCSNVGTIHNYDSALYCGGIVARRYSSSDTVRGTVYNCFNAGTIEPSYGGQIIGSEDTLSNVYDNYYVNGNLAANSVNNQNNYRISQEQAESGYLAFVLNGMTNGNVWKQKIGVDQYPKINGSEDIVYANGNCSARVTEYSNTPLSMDADKNHDLILVEAKDADCGHNGYKEHYECKSCHAFFENDTDNLPVKKSDFFTGTATGNHQTYDENGLCDVCGNAYEKPGQDENGVYVIKNTGNFIWYANAINDYNYIFIPVGDAEIQLDGFDAKLEADIDLSLVYNEESGKSWTPIAYDRSKYLNELDGQGHTINGLYINSASLNYAGLVETMYYKTAYIHDIVFTNVNINAPRAAYVGTVAGKLESLKTAPCIENCIVESGTINGKTYVGGLVGYVCANNADKFQQENKNIINNCANFANVNSTSYAGGLVGYTEANGKNVNIANSYNVGTITGGTAGDLAGKIDANTTVVNCYHIGDYAFGENTASATAEQKTAEQFESGEVAWLLNSGITDGSLVWYQNIDIENEESDTYPVLDNTHGIVYAGENKFSNNNNKRVNKKYLYSKDNEDTIDLSKYLPRGSSGANYVISQVEGSLYKDGKEPIISNEQLSYTVKEADASGATGTIEVTVTTDNYGEFTITINVELIDKIPVSLKEGSSVSLVSNILTYGEALSTLTFNSAVFVGDGAEVEGTLAWKIPTAKPDVATTKAEWVFTPASEDYASEEGEIAITVNKATNAPDMPGNTMSVPYTNKTVNEITTLPANWSWKEADKTKTLTVGEAVTATAVYAGEDAGNYETESVDISITRLGCTHEDCGTEVKGEKDATCTEMGYTGDLCCKDCGALLESGTETEMTPHTYVKGVCSVCDAVFETTVDGITYKVVTKIGEDGKLSGEIVTVSGNDIPQVAVAVTGTSGDFSVSDGKVTIPSEITGSGSEQTFVVTKISENAFAGESSNVVTEIVVPATVTEVGSGAFGDATTITFNGSTVPDGIAKAISGTEVTINVPEGAGDSYKEVLGDGINIVEVHTHKYADTWTYDDTYHWHAVTCGHEKEVADKAEHTFGRWVTVTEATEDAEGVKERSCACGYKETANIDKLAHTIHVKDEGIRVEPTCEKNGSITYKCTKCGEVMEVVELAALGHKWDGGKVTKEATETEEGVMTYTCSACGKTKMEVIPKKEATTPQQPKKGDVVADDKGTGDYMVTDVVKKEVAFRTPADQNLATISIPATVTINGVTYKVTSIADNAFANNKKLTKVTIGSNVKTIGKNAFYKCTKLKTVKIGKNVTEIGANAFKGCTSLTSVTLPGKTTKIGANAFNGCKKLKTIKITSTKLSSKTVAKNAFKGLTKATTIKVPKKKLAAYKKLLRSKGLSSKVKVVGY